MRVFHHVLLKYGHENAEMQKWQFDDVTLRYSMHNIRITAAYKTPTHTKFTFFYWLDSGTRQGEQEYILKANFNMVTYLDTTGS